MRSSWKSLRYQLEWLGVRLLAAIVPRFPRPVAVVRSRPVSICRGAALP